MCVAFGVREGQVNVSEQNNHNNVYFNTKVVFFNVLCIKTILIYYPDLTFFFLLLE